MATEDGARRSITLSRDSAGSFTATNERGGAISFGSGDDAGFTPVELLLTAIAGCSAIDVDILASRRAEPTDFTVTCGATKERDETGGNRLGPIDVTFSLSFPEGERGDAARAILPELVQLSHDRLCTVSRTVELGTPVTSTLSTTEEA